MNWYILDKDYVKCLESFDAKVGYVDYSVSHGGELDIFHRIPRRKENGLDRTFHSA